MKTWKAILGVGAGAALVGLGVKAILNNKKAKSQSDEDYIVDDEVETDGSADDSAE